MIDNPQVDSAKQIYVEFVEAVNLPDYIATSLKLWYQQITSSDEKLVAAATEPHFLQVVYNPAQTEIWNLMKSDSLQRFMKTSDYKSIKERWNADSFVRGVIAVSPSTGSRHMSKEEYPGTSLLNEPSETTSSVEQKEEMDYVL